MPYTDDPYAHRTNPDGTRDSICKKCFATIGTSKKDEVLKTLERDHICDPWKLEVVKIVSERANYRIEPLKK